jgi:AcrR family transcriptional regulator
MPKKRSQSAQRKPRTDAQRNRERILEVAKEAFARAGASTSLDDVAKQAGVGAGTLYRHFPTRDALLEAVYRTEVEKLAAAERKFAQTMHPIEALRAWMLLFVDYIAAKQIIAPALNTLVGGPSKLYEASRDQLSGAIEVLVNRAYATTLTHSIYFGLGLVSPTWRPARRGSEASEDWSRSSSAVRGRSIRKSESRDRRLHRAMDKFVYCSRHAVGPRDIGRAAFVRNPEGPGTPLERSLRKGTSAESRCYAAPRQYLGLSERSLVGEFRPLQKHSCFFEIQPWIAWVELVWVSIAQVAEEIDLPLAVGKECRIQFISVETGHRPAVQSQSACGQDEVCGLQRAVAEGVLLNQRFISYEVGSDVRMWKELGKILVELRIPGDDNGHRSGHGFVDIAGR